MRRNHIILDISGVSADVCNNDKYVIDILLNIIRELGLEVVNVCRYHLGHNSPPGFACVIMLDRGHCSAHSYADKGLIAMDLFCIDKKFSDKDYASIMKLEKLLGKLEIKIV